MSDPLRRLARRLRPAALLAPLAALTLAALTLAALTLAACGDVPQPFRPDDGTPASVLVRPPSAARVVVTTRGLPAEHAPQSETLNEAVAEALRTADLPASSRPQGRPDIQLQLRAFPEQPEARIEFAVTDAEGQAMASPPDPISVPRAELVASDPAVQAQLAARIARIAVPLIRAAETNRRAQVVRQSIEPAAAGARVAVIGVSGAPGDGNAALARQMVDALRRKGIVVQEEPAGAHFLVRAEVRLPPAEGDAQPVEIIWRVSRGDGASAGEVAQNNSVPKGTLDHYWGDVAYAVAAAAVDGVVQVMERTQADLPDWMRRAHGAPMSVAGAMPSEGSQRGGLPPMGQIGDGRSGLMPPGMPGTSDDASFGAPPAAMTQPGPGDINSGVPAPRWARAAGAGQGNGAPEEIETLVPSRVVPLGLGGMAGFAAAPMQPPMQPMGAVQLPPGYAAAQLPAGAAPAPAGIPPGYVVVYTNQGPMLVPGTLPPGFIAVPLPGAPAPQPVPPNLQAAVQAGVTSFPSSPSLTGGPPATEPEVPSATTARARSPASGTPATAAPAEDGGLSVASIDPATATTAAPAPGPAPAAEQPAAPPVATVAPQPDPAAFRRRPPARGLANRPPAPEPTPVPPPPAGATIQPGAAGSPPAPAAGPLMRAPSLSAPQPAISRPSAGLGPVVEPAPVPSPLSLRALEAAAEAGADQARLGSRRR
ncbi:MAG: hypothetical protein IT557_10505 [Alphaproteobacteria bacterium]|nr:hypothetical protein [Alphaproteobacteria bacterium]